MFYKSFFSSLLPHVSFASFVRWHTTVKSNTMPFVHWASLLITRKMTSLSIKHNGFLGFFLLLCTVFLWLESKCMRLLLNLLCICSIWSYVCAIEPIGSRAIRCFWLPHISTHTIFFLYACDALAAFKLTCLIDKIVNQIPDTHRIYIL